MCAQLQFYETIAVTARPKGWVCCRLFGGTAGSNPAGGMDVCLLRNFSFRYKSIHRGYHSSGGVMRSVACFECDREASIVKRPWPTGVIAPWEKSYFYEGIKDWLKTRRENISSTKE